MKKSGFTLAEVLITLGIIGVVAALTAPALVTSGQNQANASRLAVTVSNIENAFTNAISQEGVEKLSATKMWPSTAVTNSNVGTTYKTFAGNLGQYLHINGYEEKNFGANYYGDNKPYYMSATGGKSTSEATLGGAVAYPVFLKNGAAVFFQITGGTVKDKTKIINAGGALYDCRGEVIIDVNGKSSPNVVGRDIFRFAIGNNGILYPLGGLDYAAYLTEGDKPEDKVWKKDDVTNLSCNDGKIKNGWGCTARVIEEGYKINY